MIFSSALLIAGCGGGDGEGGSSGIDSSKTVIELSATERESLCTWSVAEQGGAGTVHMCGDGVEVTVETEAECAVDISTLSTNCPYTVAQAEACSSGDPCQALANPDCVAIFNCIPVGD